MSELEDSKARPFYQTGGTLSPTNPLYITRQADSELLKLCHEHNFGYILAPRQIGKSSLMLRTASYLQQEGSRVVLIDLARVGTQVTAQAWYYGLLYEIRKQLNLRFNLKEWWQAHAELGLTQRLTLFFEDVLLNEIIEPLVIFVDEIDTTLSLDFTDDFFAAVRSLYVMRANRPTLNQLSFVLIGVASPGDLIRDARRTPFNIGWRIEMTDFTFEEALPLAQGLGLADPQAARNLLGWIFEWTDGHPYLTQRLCQEVAQAQRQSWDRAEISRLVARTFFGEKSEQDNNLQFVRDMLTRRAPEPLAVLTTYRESWRNRRPVPDEEQSVIKSHLKLSGVVKRSGSVLKVRNPIYYTVFNQKWVKEHLPVNWAKRLRQALGLVIALTALIVVLGGLLIFALIQQSEAQTQAKLASQGQAEAIAARNTAEANRLQSDRLRQAAQAQALALKGQLAADPETGLLLAIYAAERVQEDRLEDVNSQVETTLRQLVAGYNPNRVLTGHSGCVQTVDFSPDSRTILTAGCDGTARLWDTTTGQPIRQISHSRGLLFHALFSPDGKQFVTTGQDGTVRIWETATGQEIRSFPVINNNTAFGMARFSSDGKFVLTANGVSFKSQLWEIATGKEVLTLQKHTSVVSDAKFSPDGKLIATAAFGNFAQIWDATTGQARQTLPHPDGGVTDMHFSADSKLLLTGSGDNLGRVWEVATGKELFSLRGHNAQINRAIFSPDNKLIVTVSDDTTVRLWDASTGKEINILRGHSAAVRDVIFSPDGKLLVTGSNDNTLIIWDVNSGKQLTVLRGHSGAIAGIAGQSGLAFSPDGRYLASASSDGTARLWDWQTISRQRILLSGHTNPVYSAVFSPDGKQVLSASNNITLRKSAVLMYHPDETARLWDALTGRQLTTLSGHAFGLHNAVFSPDGQTILTAGSDGTARIWDRASGKELGTLGEENANPLVAAAINPSNNPSQSFFVLAYQDNTLLLSEYDFVLPKRTIQLRGHTQPVYGIGWSSDEKQIVTASADGTARIWDSATGTQRLVLRGHSAGVNSAAFSPDGKLVVTASNDGTARIWEVSTGKELSALKGHTGPVKQARFSPDNKQIITAGSDRTARVWEVSTGRELKNLSGHSAALNDAAFSPDGKTALTASEDGTARMWDLASGKEKIILKGHQGAVNRAVFIPDGKTVVTGGADKTLRFWEVSTGKNISTVIGYAGPVVNVDASPAAVVAEDSKNLILVSLVATSQLVDQYRNRPRVQGAAFSPDGRLAITGSSEGDPVLWEVKGSKPVATLKGHSGLVGISSGRAFSPDSKLVVTSGLEDKTARIWEVSSGKELMVLQGHTQGVLDASFSPDGKLVVTAGEDGTTRLWETTTGKEVRSLKGHTGVVNSARFSPDGRFLVTAGEDGTIRLWEVATLRELVSLREHQGIVFEANFSPDGKRLVTASGDKTAEIYQCEVCGSFAEVLETAKQKTSRQLSEEERRQYGIP